MLVFWLISSLSPCVSLPRPAQSIQKYKIQHQVYDSLIMRIVRREPLTDDPTVGGFRRRRAASGVDAGEENSEASVKKLAVNTLNLQVVSFIDGVGT